MPKKSILLKWSASKPYDELVKCNYPGFYCITTVYKDNPSKLLYIGQSNGSNIKTRFSDHKRKWVDKYHGVRFSFAALPYEVFERMTSEDILCIENALIFAYDPIENVQGRKALRRDYLAHSFLINNSGCVPFGFSSQLDMDVVYQLYISGAKDNIKVNPRKGSKKDDVWEQFRPPFVKK